MKIILNFIYEEEGASIVEFGMAIGLIALVSIIATYLLAKRVNRLLSLYFRIFLWW